jgi:CMP-N,N'-diacetyllegionaminic acid synthase
MSKPSIVALIPARGGSKRVPGKNVRVLGGHPLIAYTIAPAIASGVFDAVIVSTDLPEIAEVARRYGAEVPFLRPAALAGDTSPDIEWVEHTLRTLADQGRSYDAFSLLRPTSPFRTPDTLRRAWAAFSADPRADSLRAVEKCTQHPGKMWVARGNRLLPLLPFGLPAAKPQGSEGGPVSPKLQGSEGGLMSSKLQGSEGGLISSKLQGSEDGPVSPKLPGSEGGAEQPWHSSQYQSLPLVYVQNASLEIAWTRIVFEGHTIAGEAVMPFFTDDMEGFDINNRYDWLLAEHLVASGEAKLPACEMAGGTPFDSSDARVAQSTAGGTKVLPSETGGTKVPPSR